MVFTRDGQGNATGEPPPRPALPQSAPPPQGSPEQEPLPGPMPQDFPPPVLPPPMEMPPDEPPAPPLPTPMPGFTPTGLGGTFATPATPPSLTPFRTPSFTQGRVVGAGASALSPGVPITGTGFGEEGGGQGSEDEFQRIVRSIVRSRGGRR